MMITEPVIQIIQKKPVEPVHEIEIDDEFADMVNRKAKEQEQSRSRVVSPVSNSAPANTIVK